MWSSNDRLGSSGGRSIQIIYLITEAGLHNVKQVKLLCPLQYYSVFVQ